MRYINTLVEGETIRNVYLCKGKRSAETRNGKPYDNLILQDKTGTLDGKVWDPNSSGIADYDEMDFIEVYGEVTSYNNNLQLNIRQIRRAQEGEYVPADYMPTTDKNEDQMYQELLRDWMDQMDKSGISSGASKNAIAARMQSEKAISMDAGITSSRKGFEYLNELFIKRHQRILWKASEKIAFVCLVLVLAALLTLQLYPAARPVTNELTLQFLPYFVFILYAINRGTGFTQALFMNCDNSLLTYSFYKKPGQILRLFRIRLREIIKINLLPAFVIGAGLAVLLFASGGTDNPINYAVLVVSVLCMSVFFSVHYLMIYYLLQPYTAGAEMKSGTYRIVMIVTYFVCYLMMRVQMPTLIFGLMTIVFCVAYSVIACVLVYRLAPKTFKLRL